MSGNKCGLRLRRPGWASIAALMIGSAAITNAQRQGIPKPPPPSPPGLLKLKLDHERRQFDLSDDRDLARLRDASSSLLELSQRHRRERESEQGRLTGSKSLAEMSRAELDSFYSEPDGLLTRRDQRGLDELRRLCTLAMKVRDEARKGDLINLLGEVGAALNNNHRSPVPPTIDVVELPLVHYDYTHNPIAIGETAAWNLEPRPTNAHVDASKLNPLPSSFWSPPANISSQNLFAGFGRLSCPQIQHEILVYQNPKTGFGGHAGFEAKCRSVEVKVKFGEVHSEPFAARVFWALGYNVDATDYVPELKLKYDRSFLREFNQRKEVSTRISALAVLPIYTLRFQPRHDPFEFITEAVMKDGTRLSSRQLKSAIFHDPQRENPADYPENFRPEVEAVIDHLITRRANIQIKDPKAKSIGPWSFGGLGHEGRRELRGAGLLAAWIGWSDSRFDNVRLKVVETSGGSELKHFFTDLGGGLGRSTGLIYRQGDRPNEFEWTFTLPPRFQGKGRMTIPFRITGYQPIEDTPAFEQMTIDDARWMARLIGQLTEDQIVAALIASGFGSAHVRLYTEKLVSRRDQMIDDLGLSGELPPLRPAGVDRRFSYNPRHGGPVRATLPGGRQVFTQDEPFVIEHGRLQAAHSTER